MKSILSALLGMGLAAYVEAGPLAKDGRVGSVVDLQGIVSIRPAMRKRWTLAEEGFLLKPGDWLRTDVRGANAIQVRLENRARLTLGPGTLVEAVGASAVKLVRGEIEVAAGDDARTQLIVPGRRRRLVTGTQIFRSRQNTLEKLEQKPNWLKGFKGTVTTESMGSLLAKVEGRNVPLTVGYHKVTVDIHDQIAHTVVEESFVNHTGFTLEGVFYFPLPQDASISGFAMWIGDKCVEADVVEKQRAREIYETILRERRDPGLLEWTGGNIFKARVYPIFGHSEKRVKITYTQVLPLRAGRYLYSYALQSELLKQHPLRELTIGVRVSSALPLKSVACKTHDARADRTAHAARVEFGAQEYTPDRDFEVEVEVEHEASPVVLIPHRRGEDGYFLLLLTPPDASGARPRDVLPDGDPLDFVILADTSASMGDDQRKAQGAFIAGLLSSLGEKDTFNLATCDTDCRWFAEASVPATEANVAVARDFLAGRISLGWSDLDRAFQAVGERVQPKTHLVYLGDGTITTRAGDPVAFAKRLARLHRDTPATFHAVATGSSFEPVVLKAIASLGGGSVRRIDGTNGPQTAAKELLGELTRPALRDLRIELTGLRTARVYPEELPNLPAGAQQIVLGRYLPEGRDQKGEVIVTGVRQGKRVQFRAPVTLEHAERGNSFIPRLWARMHLNALLDQGRSPEVKDEIIALSEEYNIMTPYTSFLVLESDADRARFKVKQRFRMRDGERFFADGRDSATFALAQQQMRRAGDWRIGLRRRVIKKLAEMGRDPGVFELPTPRPQVYTIGGMVRESTLAGLSMATEGGSGLGGRRVLILDSVESSGTEDGEYDHDAKELGLEVDEDVGLVNRLEGTEGFADAPSPTAPEPGVTDELLGDKREDARVVARASCLRISELTFAKRRARGRARAPSYGGQMLVGLSPLARAAAAGQALDKRALTSGGYARRYPRPSQLYRLGMLLPRLPPLAKPRPSAKTQWTAEARQLADRLLRTDRLEELALGLEIKRESKSYDAETQEVSRLSQRHFLISAKSWLVRSSRDGKQTLVHWCDGGERAALSKPLLLGRRRKATPHDLTRYQLNLGDGFLVSLAQTHSVYAPEIEGKGQGRVLLRLLHPDRAGNCQSHYLIDTERDVPLRCEFWLLGQLDTSTTFTDFIRAGGHWWPQRVETRNAHGKLVRLGILSVKQHSLEDLAKRMASELAIRRKAILLADPLPSVLEAKQEILDRKPTFEGHLVMLAYFARSQQWDRVAEHFEAMKRLAAGKPGMDWIEDEVLLLMRRREERKQRLLARAEGLAAGRKEDELFLANLIRRRAGGVCQHNEMLTFLDTIGPVYARQPKRFHALRDWEQERAQRLRAAGQRSEALRLMRTLAEEYPQNCSFQSQYARWLVEAGEYGAAYRWVEESLSVEGRWQQQQEGNLRHQIVEILERQGRIPEQAEYLAKWTARNPQNEGAYQRYLSALIRTDQVERAAKLMERWMAVPEGVERLEPVTTAQITAAVNVALGSGYNINRNRIDERWLAPLSQTARRLVSSKINSGVASRIMQDRRFQATDACRELRREFAQVLRREAASLDVSRVQALVNWIWPNDPAVETAVWQEIASKLEARWAKETDGNVRNLVGQTIAQILSGRVGTSQNLAFLRRQWREGLAQFRDRYASQLFDVLLSQPWSKESEDGAFRVLHELGHGSPEMDPLNAQIPALYRLNDWAVRARYKAAMDAVENKEGLSRTELRELRSSKLREARTALVERLRREVGQAAGEGRKRLVPWLHAERVYLRSRLRQNAGGIATECWEHLGAEPPTSKEPWEWHRALVSARFLQTLEHLAARPDVDPALQERLLAYLDKGLKANPDDAAWKRHKFWLLVALDRPQDLERALRSWIRPGQADATWRLALGYLLAETNRIPEAIRQFEAIKAVDELLPSDYRALADWYLVVGQRDEHEEALVQALMTTSERQLSIRIERERRRWDSRGAVPEELAPQVIRAFTALFRKARDPRRYLWLLQHMYGKTKDFRLLECLSEAMVGHTAEGAYPFLQRLNNVLNEMLDEAATDSIVEHLARVRERTKTTVDRRSLDLFEVQLRRRAAEVKNQPGPHVEAALSAMRRAFKGEWLPGERRLMADVLAEFGRISQAPLAVEQLGQLRNLHRGEKPGTYDRLRIAHARARCRWAYDRRSEATDLLQAALDEYRQASRGVLPRNAQSAFDCFVSYLESQRHYARGEKVILGEQERPVNQQMGHWLRQRLFRLYDGAITHKAEVSLGSGHRLYRAVERQRWSELGTADHSHRYALVDQLCTIYRSARRMELPGVCDDLKAFAYGRFVEALAHQTSNYQDMVNRVADTMRELSGPREGLAFLIDRIEREPAWFHYANRDGWRHHAWRMGYWRSQAKDIGELAPRLLRIVTDELRRELATQQSRSGYIYRRNNQFWAERADVFAKVAEEVWRQKRGSGAAASYIAGYLFDGLERKGRAVAMLLDAYSRNVLGESAQSQLVDYLHRTDRHRESVPILAKLVSWRPDNLEYRVRLMHAYFRRKRGTELRKLLAETDAHFREGGRWNEKALSELAKSCLTNELFGESVAYYKELIARHQRTHPRRGIGNGKLSSYYAQMASAYRGLGQTEDAVEAAAGAIVSWGPRHRNRRYAVDSLKLVLRGSPDLNGYAKTLDQQVAQTGLDSPIVRKALGQVFLGKREYGRAIYQLTVAAQSQPNDAETHQALIEAYDAQGDGEGAIRQLRTSARLSRRNIAFYRDLGERLVSLGRDQEAERAFTSVVEMQPTESESHAMLAEIREQQNRWPEAIAHWQRVAALRALEPTGLEKLARAQIHEKQWADARESIKKLLARNWPERFRDVHARARKVLREAEGHE